MPAGSNLLIYWINPDPGVTIPEIAFIVMMELFQAGVNAIIGVGLVVQTVKNSSAPAAVVYFGSYIDDSEFR